MSLSPEFIKIARHLCTQAMDENVPEEHRSSFSDALVILVYGYIQGLDGSACDHIEYGIEEPIYAVPDDMTDYKIKTWIKPMENKEDWKPEMHETYWYISSKGTPKKEVWENGPNQNKRREFLGVFKTEVEANEKLEQIKNLI